MVKALKIIGWTLGVIAVITGFWIMTEWTMIEPSLSEMSFTEEPHPYRNYVGWGIVAAGVIHATLFEAVSRIYESTVKE